MFNKYNKMSPLDFKINDKQIDKKWLGGLFIFASIVSQTS